MISANLNDIKGIKIGHAHNREAVTGCSVVISKKGSITGVDIRGGAPGTRETALLAPEKMVRNIHAIVLAGGSAYGLDAASGVMKYLEEKNIGFDVGVGKVPIVPSAILFDLNIGKCAVRPDKSMGYRACQNTGKKLKEGNIGAGMGATVGKIKGPEYAMKGGLGMAAYKINDLIVGAMVVVNCLGDVVSPDTGEIIAGTLNEEKNNFADSKELILKTSKEKNFFSGNTTLGVIITNAKLNKVETNRIASHSHNGLARTMSPAHTEYDGDTIFTMATGEVKTPLNMVKIMAVKSVEDAVVNGIKNAAGLAGYPSIEDIC